MPLNAQAKGKEGEREIARALNAVVDDLLRELGLPPQDPRKPRIQRNQNQSAVGGCDLSGTFEIAIEVKRQEQLSINTWWSQCVSSASALGHHPVLVFRQNAAAGSRKGWRVVTLVEVGVPGSDPISCRAEIAFEDFLKWFKAWAREHLVVEYQLAPRKTAQLPPTIAVLPAQDEAIEGVQDAPLRLRLPDLFAE